MAVTEPPKENKGTRMARAAKAKRFIESTDREPRTPFSMRYSADLLAEIKAAAKEDHLSTSAWIEYNLAQILRRRRDNRT
jgi:hypothetical protein